MEIIYLYLISAAILATANLWVYFLPLLREGNHLDPKPLLSEHYITAIITYWILAFMLAPALAIISMSPIWSAQYVAGLRSGMYLSE